MAGIVTKQSRWVYRLPPFQSTLHVISLVLHRSRNASSPCVVAGRISAAGVLWCVVLLTLATAMANVQAAPRRAGLDDPIKFDVPAQALATALDAYGLRTGLGVLIDAGNKQRISSAIHGRYTPQEAIDLMLAGTGLQARIQGNEAVIITPAVQASPGMPETPDSASTPANLAVMVGHADYRSYVGRVQARVVDVLCGSDITRPGTYRLAIELWLGRNAGEVLRIRLLGTTGESVRDDAIVRSLGRTTMAESPPSALPQPFTLLLLPDGDGLATRCPAPSAGT